MATDKKRSLLTESQTVGVFRDVADFQQNFKPSEATPPKKELLRAALDDTKQVRNDALKNAHEALENAFGPKIKQALKGSLEAPQQSAATESSSETTSIQELETLLVEFGLEHEDDDMMKECRKRLDEANDPGIPATEKEKMYKDIHRKFWAYVQSLPNHTITDGQPKTATDKAVAKFLGGGNCGIEWISHEGSTIVCALIAVADCSPTVVSLRQLPEGDRTIVQAVLVKNGIKHSDHCSFFVKFDEYKNFDFELIQDKGSKEVKFTVGNRVSSIPPTEASRYTDVKVERKGKDILIGDRIKLERTRVQSLLGEEPQTNKNSAQQRNGFQPRQKVAGRNAYEIRADVLEMALDWAKASDEYKKMDAEDVLAIADAFYGFVEQK